MIRNLLTMTALVAALAACSRQTPPAEGPTDPASMSQTAAPEPMPPSPSAGPVAQPGVPAAAKSIPEGMRGRFGLVPADCTATRGDDKGLLTVGPNSLKFYESVALLRDVGESTATHLKAHFAYSGEGMEWTRNAVLDLTDGGRTLILEEFGDDAVPGPRTYTRCPARP